MATRFTNGQGISRTGLSIPSLASASGLVAVVRFVSGAKNVVRLTTSNGAPDDLSISSDGVNLIFNNLASGAGDFTFSTSVTPYVGVWTILRLRWSSGNAIAIADSTTLSSSTGPTSRGNWVSVEIGTGTGTVDIAGVWWEKPGSSTLPAGYYLERIGPTWSRLNSVGDQAIWPLALDSQTKDISVNALTLSSGTPGTAAPTAPGPFQFQQPYRDKPRFFPVRLQTIPLSGTGGMYTHSAAASTEAAVIAGTGGTFTNGSCANTVSVPLTCNAAGTYVHGAATNAETAALTCSPAGTYTHSSAASSESASLTCNAAGTYTHSSASTSSAASLTCAAAGTFTHSAASSSESASLTCSPAGTYTHSAAQLFSGLQATGNTVTGSAAAFTTISVPESGTGSTYVHGSATSTESAALICNAAGTFSHGAATLTKSVVLTCQTAATTTHSAASSAESAALTPNTAATWTDGTCTANAFRFIAGTGATVTNATCSIGPNFALVPRAAAMFVSAGNDPYYAIQVWRTVDAPPVPQRRQWPPRPR